MKWFGPKSENSIPTVVPNKDIHFTYLLKTSQTTLRERENPASLIIAYFYNRLSILISDCFFKIQLRSWKGPTTSKKIWRGFIMTKYCWQCNRSYRTVCSQDCTKGTNKNHYPKEDYIMENEDLLKQTVNIKTKYVRSSWTKKIKKAKV